MTDNHITLLFIGAGPSQMEGIIKAKNMGYRVISVDEDPNSVGFKFSDRYFIMNIFEHEKIIEIAREQNVNAAISIASDICLETTAIINEALDFKALTKDQVLLATNKGLLRKKLRDIEGICPQFFLTRSDKDISDFINIVNFPVVMKPVDSSGSRGVLFIKNKAELLKNYNSVLDFSRTGQVIVEEFMEGPEIAIEAFVIKNELFILCISDKLRTQPPYLLDTALTFPTAHPIEIQKSIKNVLRTVVSEMGIDNVPIHAEMIITENGPKLVEIAARGAGFKVFTKIIPYVTGIDTLQMQIDLLLGNSINIDQIQIKNNAACLRFFSGRDGILESISGLEKAKEFNTLEEIEIYPQVGIKVADLRSGQDRIGHLITFSEDKNIAVKHADQIYNIIKINIA